jgi:hypothetical protein
MGPVGSSQRCGGFIKRGCQNEIRTELRSFSRDFRTMKKLRPPNADYEDGVEGVMRAGSRYIDKSPQSTQQLTGTTAVTRASGVTDPGTRFSSVRGIVQSPRISRSSSTKSDPISLFAGLAHAFLSRATRRPLPVPLAPPHMLLWVLQDAVEAAANEGRGGCPFWSRRQSRGLSPSRLPPSLPTMRVLVVKTCRQRDPLRMAGLARLFGVVPDALVGPVYLAVGG